MTPSHESPAASQASPRRILVWDVPVRVFHWLLVACFAGAWLTAESERWRLVHVTLGWTLAGLVVFRLVWGLAGTRHARFASFVRGPRAVARYLGSMLAGRPESHVGHNPAGGWAIVALLALAGGVAATGWATLSDFGGEGLEEAHELAAELMLAMAGLHLVGVISGSWLHGENLVRAMVTGRKSGDPSQAAGGAARTVGAFVVAAVLVFWAVQWREAPAALQARSDGTPAGQSADDDD